MPDEAALQVGFLCYPRLTQLDMTGPYEILVRMPNNKRLQCTHAMYA